jgi:hypothetical protein
MNIKTAKIEKTLALEIESAYNGDFNIAIYGDENGEIVTHSFSGNITYIGNSFFYELRSNNPQGNWEYEDEDELEIMIEEKSYGDAQDFLAKFETWLTQTPEEREETRTGDYR